MSMLVQHANAAGLVITEAGTGMWQHRRLLITCGLWSCGCCRNLHEFMSGGKSQSTQLYQILLFLWKSGGLEHPDDLAKNLNLP